MTNNFQDKANFIWQVADDILRGAFKAHEYGDVTLPFVVLRRLDCVLRDKKGAVISTYKAFKDVLEPHQMEQVVLQSTGGMGFYNVSDFDLERLTDDANNIDLNFNAYLNGFSENVREILGHYKLDRIVEKLAKNDLLFMMCHKFTEVDLHPEKVSNHDMGSIFEELLRRFSEMSNETAGEHYTPHEVIRLMVNLLFAEHAHEIEGKGIVRRIYDPACGTGGMLTIAKEHIQAVNPEADSCSPTRRSASRGKRSRVSSRRRPRTRAGASAPGRRARATGPSLFLQHMIAKRESRGSRVAIIFNGSPLFTGDAGGGESNIRRWIIENDWLEAIVALPTELFYNTGIATYIWIVTNKKPARRRGKVQLINAADFSEKMLKSLGNKRTYITGHQIRQITDLYTAFEEGDNVRIFDNEDFGYVKVRVERPKRDKKGRIVRDRDGSPKPDTALRDYERVPLKEDVDVYFEREVRPHVPDAWMDREADKVGYEINFTRYFYEYERLRSVEEITRDILALDAETEGLLKQVLDLKPGPATPPVPPHPLRGSVLKYDDPFAPAAPEEDWEALR